VPCRWGEARAEELAAAHDAVLAVGRRVARDRPGAVSLSPAGIAAAAGLERLVLPSPNGSTLARLLSEHGRPVVAACLRNAAAAGRLVAARLAAGAAVVVVPAGERWPDGSLRPAVEDLWGAGAVVAAAVAAGGPSPGASPEARAAAAAWTAVAATIADDLAACASGVELVAAGFADDVAVAAAYDVTDRVPTLVDGVFVAG
jgi:2-phosphosulfolactate phosphatase